MADDHKLTPQEERLIACAASGFVWVPETEGDEKPDLDPAKADTWAANRTLRAEVIRCLAAGVAWPGHKKPWPVGPKGLMIDGARISGDLDLEGATINCAIFLHRCAIEGRVILMTAQTRSLSFDGCHLAQGCMADGLHVRGILNFRHGFASKGAVSLRSAKIEGQLCCIKGCFENPSGTAIQADAITVRGDVFLRQGFTARGEVNLRGAEIDGQLACDKGNFDNPDGFALNANAITVGADVFLSDGFAAKGEVDFARASIKGAFFCRTASFDNPKGDAIKLTSAEIGAGLFLTKLSHGKGQPGIAGRLVLGQAICRTYCDDKEAWPEPGKLVLDGFTYERFQACATDWQTRLDWLERQPDDQLRDRFHPQPWMQVAKVLREMGHDDDAKELGLRREIARAKSAGLRWHEKFWLGFLRLTIGNGYKPHWALIWSAGFFVLGWLTFAMAANLGFMAPRDGSVLAYLAEDQSRHLPVQYSRFNAPLYALDAFLPVIELGQDTAWAPSNIQTGTRRVTTDGWAYEAVRLVLGHDWSVQATAHPGTVGDGFWDHTAAFAVWTFRHGFHRFVYWTMDVLGWIFVSLYIAGMSGVVKRDK